MKAKFLNRSEKPDLAYHYTQGDRPIVMFCGGYRSDMNGTKAVYLERECIKRGQGYLRFDYSGHGESGGAFNDGTIRKWFEDALDIFDAVINGPVVIVGSSMGGWIGLLLAQARANFVKGMVGIAAAPDFTEHLYHQELNAAQRFIVEEQGYISIPNDYSDEPYHFTKMFFDDAKDCLVLKKGNTAKFPMSLIHGLKDKDVPAETPQRIKDIYIDSHVEITCVEDGDHRLSRPQDLELINQEIMMFS